MMHQGGAAANARCASCTNRHLICRRCPSDSREAACRASCGRLGCLQAARLRRTACRMRQTCIALVQSVVATAGCADRSARSKISAGGRQPRVFRGLVLSALATAASASAAPAQYPALKLRSAPVPRPDPGNDRKTILTKTERTGALTRAPSLDGTQRPSDDGKNRGSETNARVFGQDRRRHWRWIGHGPRVGAPVGGRGLFSSSTRFII